MALTIDDDKVWFDSKNKLREICKEVQSESGNGSKVLVLSHFPVTLSGLHRLLGERAIKLVEFSLYDSSRLCSSPPGTIWLGLARAFQSPAAPSMQNPQASQLRIIVAEHHPRQSRDQELINAAAKLPCDSQLRFHFSLDDPLLEHSGAASIRKLFQQLGIEETESITHPLVTSAIRNAQEKIEKQVPKDVQTESIEDWFKYNLPEMKEY